MDEKTLPLFENIVRLDDAWVQNHLSGAPDEVIASALNGAPHALRVKLLKNLSPRRRDGVIKAAGDIPDRTREVAREVLVRVLWDLPDPKPTKEPAAAPEPDRKIDYVRLMKWFAEKNPAVAAAQEERRRAMEQGILRHMLGLKPKDDA